MCSSQSDIGDPLYVINSVQQLTQYHGDPSKQATANVQPGLLSY